MMLVSLSMLMVGNVNIAFPTMLAGAEKAVQMTIKLWAIYAVWLGLLKVFEDTKLANKLSAFMQKPLRLILGKHDSYTEEQISINIVSNIFGMGNASTPSGINAIYGMWDKQSKKATRPMLVLFVLNTVNLQLIPTTIISLRALAGSVNPNDTIFPTILTSVISIVFGLVLIFVCDKLFKVFKGKKYKSKTTKRSGVR